MFGEEFVMPGGADKHEPVDFTFTAEPLTFEPVRKLAKCVICDKEFQLGENCEGTHFDFSVYSKTLEPPIEVNSYDICHKCFLWIPKVAVRALRRIHAEPLLLSGGSGGETPILSSDSWECKPGGDLSIQGGQGGNDVSKGAMVVGRDGDLTCLP